MTKTDGNIITGCRVRFLWEGRASGGRHKTSSGSFWVFQLSPEPLLWKGKQVATLHTVLNLNKSQQKHLVSYGLSQECNIYPAPLDQSSVQLQILTPSITGIWCSGARQMCRVPPLVLLPVSSLFWQRFSSWGFIKNITFNNYKLTQPTIIPLLLSPLLFLTLKVISPV